MVLRAVIFSLLMVASAGAPAGMAYEHPGELVNFPGPWIFQIPKSHLILVTDQELEALTDPDRVIDLSLTYNKEEKSLRQVCEEAQARGADTLILAFDHFFAQYRPGQHVPRTLTPDMDAYIGHVAKISQFAQGYGLGLELSLLSPLEVGPAFRARTGESGLWLHYRKGLRDPQTGAYSVDLWRQTRWANNKGPIDIEDAGIRVFAFLESVNRATPYNIVPPETIVEISDTAQVETYDGLRAGTGVRIRVHGAGRTDIGPMDRVLVVQQYRTPEMDYFSDQALPFLKELVDKYAAAGVRLTGLYSDEMHIQQDWGYFNHHDHGEFALRYVSPGFAKRYAERYGAQYADFAKYLVYFVHGQDDYAHDLTAKEPRMHAFGNTPAGIQETALFRSRYYHLLQDGVVDLFTEAKRYAEEKMGRRLHARAHATWAESPTIDRWNTGRDAHQPNQYEYTSNFVWSCTVHQAASACYDYFKWGDFLTGNGNDHAEGGWIDRDYYALALACSTGILNEVPYSYGAHWGVPGAVNRRRQSLVNAYGAAASPFFGLVQDMAHRDTDVLMLYPLDLVAVEERFGSWMTQYGYANYVSQAKLLERGRVVDGAIEMAGRRFTTVATLFEPFPSAALLDMLAQLAASGGKVVWSGPPPVLTAEGGDALGPWQSLFGVDFRPEVMPGRMAPGRQVMFEGPLAGVAPQMILTDLLVDHIYPVTPREGTETAARVAGHVVGAARPSGNGRVAYLGYRPRDDQAASLGYETRNWFDILAAMRAYAPTGKFDAVNDNTDYVSRTSPYMVCRFPNGALTIAPHFKDVPESWPGGFARKPDDDAKWEQEHPLAPDTLALQDFKAHGHNVTYGGTQAVAFRTDDAQRLIAFAGTDCDHIAVDGRETRFASAPMALLAWAPVSPERRVPGGALLQAYLHGGGTITLPAPGLPERVELVAEGKIPGSRGAVIPCRREGETLVFEATPEAQGRWLYAVPLP